MTEHELTCDVLVAGGGPAGVPAAIAAARCGARVVLCHDRPVLGGNASSEVRMHIVGADESGGRTTPLQTEARETGLIEEIRLETCVRNPQRSASMLDLILYEKCRNEPNLTLLLNTAVVGAVVQDDRVTHAIAERMSTEDRFRIAAKVFIDCTGDGRLGVESGAPFRSGREAAHEFGESRAVPEADDRRLGSTLLFQAKKHDRDMPFVPPTWARKFTENDLRLRPHATGGVDRGLEYGYWWCEWGGELDTIKDNERIRDELLAILLGVWDHIKNGPPDDPAYPNPNAHGAANWALDWFGFLPGKRESRRFVGQHVLTEQDVMQSRPFADAIAYGGWSIDLHPPRGVDAADEEPCRQDKVPHLYDIPLRACVSSTRLNLMFAGRNISATHVAFASTRVMATCAVVGQGIGTAAAYAAGRDVMPADLSASVRDMRAIQQRLLRDGAYLINITHSDERDLARRARVTASSQQSDGNAAYIVSGQTRAVHGPQGALPERAGAGTHRWMSDPADRSAWIELRWPEPVMLARIEVTFDTGLHRALTLSHSDAYVAKMQWGRPQSETVADYHIDGDLHDTWSRLVEIKGNYQRRRVHTLASPTLLHSIRLTVTATNGLDHARVMEIRAYGLDASFV